MRRNVILRSVCSGVFPGSKPEGYGLEIYGNYIASWQLARTFKVGASLVHNSILRPTTLHQ